MVLQLLSMMMVVVVRMTALTGLVVVAATPRIVMRVVVAVVGVVMVRVEHGTGGRGTHIHRVPGEVGEWRKGHTREKKRQDRRLRKILINAM